MKTTLPDRQTKQPPRDGLVFYEIIADGIIHTAAVFGIRRDVNFVERVAALAWSAGVHLAGEDLHRAVQVARRLSESLEIGRSEALRKCTAVAAAVEETGNTFDLIRAYYHQNHGTRVLGFQDPEAIRTIRQLIGEAALCGILSRGLAPELYQAIKAQNDLCCLETEYLRMVLLLWSQGNGFPPCHPFIEMAECCYTQRPHERSLVCGALGRLLPGLLEKGDPWALENWLTPAWREGIMQTKFAPDVIVAALAEFEEGEVQTNHEIFDVCIQVTEKPDGGVDLDAAFARYLERWNPYGLGNEELRKMCPRFLAARAFDFAIWMGIFAELPLEHGGKRGAT